jgi:iron complex outermembrane receptor protein
MKLKLLAAAVAAASAPVAAQETKKPDEVKKQESITVTASPLGRAASELAQPATVLSEEELRRKRAASIGDTLGGELGVQSSAFGAGSGRPIIRGLDGPRVRVLENGIGTGDASSHSPDHAVTTEALRADQIEILRGPASLLYGSGAIGGVVNVVSKTIPRERIQGLRGEAELRGGSANDERTGSFNLEGGAGDVAWHLDAFKRRTRDYEIPGAAQREGTVSHEHHEGEEEGEHEAHAPTGRLPNSDVDMHGFGGGASWFGRGGYVGAGAQKLENDYGVPTGEGVRIRMKQERGELATEWADPLPGFSRLRARAAHSRYMHDEIEEGGEIGTTFRNKATEARFELQHLAPWSGTIGAQVQRQDLSALGEEAILPPTRSRANALFAVGELPFGDWTFDAGIRLEREERRPDADLPAREFDLTTPALGLVWRVSPEYRFSIAATQAQRAPSAEELYSFGPHHATATFDIGDANLRKEISRNVDVTFRKVTGDARWKVNVYANRVKDYVYGASVDADGDGVPDRIGHDGEPEADGEFLVQRYTQAEARFRGIEAEWSYRPAAGFYGVRIFGDLTRAKLASGSNLPRIAPARVGFEADAAWGAWTGSFTTIHAFEQKRVAELETPTPSYTRVDAEIAWRLDSGARRSITVFLQGSNLLDEEIRLHTSYLKDVAPQMGRSFALGVRAQF